MGVKFTGGYKSLQLTKVSTPDVSADPLFNDVLLLVQPETGDTSITDKSSYNRTISITSGTPSISTAVQRFSQPSVFVDNDLIETPDSPELVMGTADFTIECWFYFGSFPSQSPAFFGQAINSNNFWNAAYNDAPGGPGLGFFGRELGTLFANVSEGSKSAYSTGNWYHAAWTRQGTTLRIFRDGLLIASGTVSASIPGFNAPYDILSEGGSLNTRFVNSYFTGLRVTKNHARYTANFTPPSGPFPT